MDCNSVIQQQLSSTGWAPIDPALAKFLHPELHSEYQISSWLTVPDSLLKRFPRTVLVKAHVEGFGVVPILTRSRIALAERIGWLTGGAVELVEEGRPAATEAGNKAQAVPIPPRRERAIPDDVEGLDVQTKEPPRSCLACGNRTNDGGCLPAKRGEMKGRPEHYRPTADHPRRCVHYVPGYHLVTGERRDPRTGRELWPELVPKVSAPAPVPVEPRTAAEQARNLLLATLRDGPCDAAEILAAAEEAGISERSTQRAAEALGVVKTRAAFRGGWVWALPEGARAAAQAA